MSDPANRQGIAQLAELQARLAAIVSSSDDAIVSKDLNGIVQSWNEGAMRIFGYTAEEMIGQPILRLIPADRPGEEDRILERLRRGERVDHFETVRVRKDGRRIHVSVTISPVRDAAGRVIGASKVARDITERTQVNERIRESEGRLRALVDTAVDGILTVDERGTVGSFNPAAQRMFGYEPSEIVGRNVNQLIPGGIDDGGSVVSEHPHASNSATVGVAREVLGRRKDGSSFPLDLAVSELELGNRCLFTAIVRDITERKRAEEERERLLQSERAARSEAERASRLKDEFLATVSHELRTPLNAIYGWSQLLKRKQVKDEELLEGLEVIARNAKVQTQLVEDLLDMSRIVSGKLRLDIQSVDLTDVIDAAVRTILPAAQAKEIMLQKIIDPAAGLVSGDPNRLQQVIWNLLSNAVKFTSKGGSVQVLLERINSHVKLRVSDSGQGVAPEFLPHLFERFQQADATTTRRHGGLGLGLAIVKHLVELHGGTVGVSSAGLNQGTTFTICLPVRAALLLEAPEDVPRQFARPPAVRAVSLAGIRVLVVDDEVDAQRLVARILEEHGASVVTAGSVEEALAALRRQRPDVLLSDIGMPEVDGYSFLKRVRELPLEEGGAVQAVALTAFARSEDRTRALLEGFLMHLPKPVEPAELVTVVAKAAQRV